MPTPMTAAEFAELVKARLAFDVTLFGDRDREIREVGVISGGAGNDGIMAAVEKGLDCLLPGEVGHSSWHLMRESGITVAAGGHYATETSGLLALKTVLENRFDVECEFVDIPTGL